MVFNTLSFNVDDHAKNFSFMMDKSGSWDLALAYDITFSYGKVKEHLTTIRGKGKDFNLDDYLYLAKKNLIEPKKAKQIIKKTIAVLQTFEQKALVVGLSRESVNECMSKINTQIAIL
jgi:serine/threonine-protein kinase HipA